ncbi:hypothetical protein BKA93DRAFT_752314 [Sparassis latifolia]
MVFVEIKVLFASTEVQFARTYVEDHPVSSDSERTPEWYAVSVLFAEVIPDHLQPVALFVKTQYYTKHIFSSVITDDWYFTIDEIHLIVKWSLPAKGEGDVLAYSLWKQLKFSDVSMFWTFVRHIANACSLVHDGSFVLDKRLDSIRKSFGFYVESYTHEQGRPVEDTSECSAPSLNESQDDVPDNVGS